MPAPAKPPKLPKLTRLDKGNALAGAVIKVHDDRPLTFGNDSLLSQLGMEQRAVPFLEIISSSRGSKGLDPAGASSKFKALPGALLEVVDRPKRRGPDGDNTVYVRDASGREGHLYFSQVIACCSLSAPAPAPAGGAAPEARPEARKPKM